MSKYPLRGLGKRLGLHILLPIIYTLSLVVAMFIKTMH